VPFELFNIAIQAQRKFIIYGLSNHWFRKIWI